MKKPTDEEFDEMFPDASWRHRRDIHDAGIEWAAKALEAEGHRLMAEEGQAEFAAAALMSAATIRRLAAGGDDVH